MGDSLFHNEMNVEGWFFNISWIKISCYATPVCNQAT